MEKEGKAQCSAVRGDCGPSRRKLQIWAAEEEEEEDINFELCLEDKKAQKYLKFKIYD